MEEYEKHHGVSIGNTLGVVLGANFPLAGLVMTDEPPLWAAALRFLVGVAVMIALVGLRGESLSVPPAPS